MFVDRIPGTDLPPHSQRLLSLLAAETAHLRALMITGLVLAAAVLISITARPGSAMPRGNPAAIDKSVAVK